MAQSGERQEAPGRPFDRSSLDQALYLMYQYCHVHSHIMSAMVQRLTQVAISVMGKEFSESSLLTCQDPWIVSSPGLRFTSSIEKHPAGSIASSICFQQP